MDLLLQQPLGWGTLANMLFIGVWVDGLRPFVPAVRDNLWAQVPYLLLGTLLMGRAADGS